MLVGTMAFSQSVTVEVDLDTLFTLVEKKDKIIGHAFKQNVKLKDMINEKDIELEEAYGVIDSLNWYKKYYKHSKHVIGPRVIRKIEAMVRKDETLQ